MEEYLFEDYWELFSPDPDFANRRSATSQLWELCLPDRRRAIIEWLKAGKPRCTRNPYFFVLDFRQPRRKELTFQQYYAQFGTTEERDGWRRVFLPDKQQTIFVK